MVVVVGLASGSAMEGSDKPVDGDQLYVIVVSGMERILLNRIPSFVVDQLELFLPGTTCATVPVSFSMPIVPGLILLIKVVCISITFVVSYKIVCVDYDKNDDLDNCKDDNADDKSNDGDSEDDKSDSGDSEDDKSDSEDSEDDKSDDEE